MERDEKILSDHRQDRDGNIAVVLILVAEIGNLAR